MNDEILAKLIDKWFTEHSHRADKWSRTETGAAIKNNLLKIGNWKNARRGNPKRAKRASDLAKAIKAGFIEEKEESNNGW